jgi:hypothetical protein
MTTDFSERSSIAFLLSMGTYTNAVHQWIPSPDTSGLVPNHTSCAVDMLEPANRFLRQMLLLQLQLIYS